MTSKDAHAKPFITLRSFLLAAAISAPAAFASHWSASLIGNIDVSKSIIGAVISVLAFSAMGTGFYVAFWQFRDLYLKFVDFLWVAFAGFAAAVAFVALFVGTSGEQKDALWSLVNLDITKRQGEIDELMSHYCGEKYKVESPCNAFRLATDKEIPERMRIAAAKLFMSTRQQAMPAMDTAVLKIISDIRAIGETRAFQIEQQFTKLDPQGFHSRLIALLLVGLRLSKAIVEVSISFGTLCKPLWDKFVQWLCKH